MSGARCVHGYLCVTRCVSMSVLKCVGMGVRAWECACTLATRNPPCQANFPLPSVNTSRTDHPKNAFPDNSSRCNTCRSVCDFNFGRPVCKVSRSRHGRERFGGCESGWAVIIHETPGMDFTSSLTKSRNIRNGVCLRERKTERKPSLHIS